MMAGHRQTGVGALEPPSRHFQSVDMLKVKRNSRVHTSVSVGVGVGVANMVNWSVDKHSSAVQSSCAKRALSMASGNTHTHTHMY